MLAWLGTSQNLFHYEDDLNEIAKKWGDKAPTGHLMLLNEDFGPGIALHQIDFLAKEFPQEPPNNSAVSKIIVALHKLTPRPYC